MVVSRVRAALPSGPYPTTLTRNLDMRDWKQIAETLRDNLQGDTDLSAAAIALCELAAKLPPGEAERVLEAAVAKRASCWCERKPDGSGWFNPGCPRHDMRSR